MPINSIWLELVWVLFIWDVNFKNYFVGTSLREREIQNILTTSLGYIVSTLVIKLTLCEWFYMFSFRNVALWIFIVYFWRGLNKTLIFAYPVPYLETFITFVLNSPFIDVWSLVGPSFTIKRVLYQHQQSYKTFKAKAYNSKPILENS